MSDVPFFDVAFTIYNEDFPTSGPHSYSLFASDFEGTRRGWPARINTNLGNNMPLVRKYKKVDSNGDVMYVRYVQEFGCVSVKFFND